MVESKLVKEISPFLSERGYLTRKYESKKKYTGKLWQIIPLDRMFDSNIVRLIFPFLTNEINVTDDNIYEKYYQLAGI